MLLIMLCACAPNIPVDNTIWQNKHDKIAVALAELPTPTLYKTGNQGLIDVVINDQVSRQFQMHLHHYPLNNFINLKAEFMNRLRAQGLEAVSYDKAMADNQLNYSNKDTNQYAVRNFEPYANHIGTNKLLLLSISQVGATRKYYGFIPLGAPSAFCSAEGQLIDLTTNRILWRQTVVASLHVMGHWHQPPNYPDFDKALDIAINTVKLQLINSFFNR